MADTATPDKQLTAAEAAKRVKRSVVQVKRDKTGATEKDESGNPVTETKLVDVGAGEVLAWRDYGDRVVVITKDGCKLSSSATATRV